MSNSSKENWVYFHALVFIQLQKNMNDKAGGSSNFHIFQTNLKSTVLGSHKH